MVIAERACNDAMPVAMINFSVADNKSPHEANGSRPTASGTHTAPKPNSSMAAAARCASFIGCMSSWKVHRPNLPSEFFVSVMGRNYSPTEVTRSTRHR